MRCLLDEPAGYAAGSAYRRRIVLGTLLAWIISYYVGKKILVRSVRSLNDNPDIVKTIQALRKIRESNQNVRTG